MSEVVSQYVQLESTFADGAMRLLRSDYAQTSIALLRELFADGTTHRDSEVFYAQVDAMLDELDIADCKIWRHGDGSKLDAREVVNEKWVREFKLLERRILPTGESEHSLRPEALAVLAATDDISNETIKLSSPRVEMIVEALKKLSMVVNPDPVAQRKDLVEKVKEAQKALDDFDRYGKLTGDLNPIAMYHNALDLMSQVPVDMSRIEEMMYEERNNLIDSFHQDGRPGGELVAEYLARSDDLFSGTDSGQVYNGAIRMLSNRRLNSQISRRVRMICRSEPMQKMEPTERMALEHSWKNMVNGMQGVLKLRRSCSETVANAITQYDHEVYREYTANLKELYRLVLDRCLTHPAIGRSLMIDPIGTSNVETLMYRMSTKPTRQPPPPLHVADRDSLPKIDLERLRFFGAARTQEVLDAIEAFIPESGEIRLAAAFNQIDLDLRREVELAGLMRFALLAGGAVETGPRATYLCRDIEGSIRAWSAPDMIVVRTSVETLKGEFNV